MNLKVTYVIKNITAVSFATTFSILFSTALFANTAEKTSEASETTTAMTLSPDLEAGKKTYELCATCHDKTGWGKTDGSFPVIAGQHRSVIIKQLADIRARNRENPTMYPFTGKDVLGGPQGIENVAAYIAQLPVNPDHGKGKGLQPEKGKQLFEEKCAVCHGKQGQGNAENFFPRIQGQHYAYVLRQLKWIRDGLRKNANPVMLAQIKDMDDKTLSIIADYVSHIKLEAQVK